MIVEKCVHLYVIKQEVFYVWLIMYSKEWDDFKDWILNLGCVGKAIPGDVCNYKIQLIKQITLVINNCYGHTIVVHILVFD